MSTYDTQLLGTTCPACREAVSVPLRVLTRKGAPKCPSCGGELSRKALEVTMNETAVGVIEDIQKMLAKRKKSSNGN